MTITKEGIFVSDDFSPTPDGLEGAPSIGHQLLESLAQEHMSHLVALVDAASGREWTRAQLREQILNVATGLVDLYDFRPGTCVAIHYDHSDHAVVLALAVVAAGGIVACAYPKDPYAELLQMARRTEPKFLFCHQRKLDWAQQLSQELGYVVTAIPIDGEQAGHSFQALLRHDHKQSPARQLIPVACADRDRDLAFVIMSSGTTGPPKAIPVTHSMVINDDFNCTKYSGTVFTLLFHISLDYLSGRVILISSLRSGLKTVIVDRAEPRIVAEAIERFRINIVSLGAVSFFSIITDREFYEHDTSSLTVAFPTGAKVNYIDEMKVFLERHPNIKVVRTSYGASEYSVVTGKSMKPDEYLACSGGNCGKLRRGFQVKIVDPNSPGKLLGMNEVGLLVVKGPTLFPGYYDVARIHRSNKESKSTNGISETNGILTYTSPFVRDPARFDADGFFITDDFAYFNEREELFIVGRRTEFMICRGQKVTPDKIERVLMSHPAVLKVCVLGVRSKAEYDRPRAFIVPRACCYDATSKLPLIRPVEQEASPKELLEYAGRSKLCSLPVERRHKIAEDVMEFANERLGWRLHLTGGIVLLDNMPTLRETGKLNKSYLKSLTSEQVEIYGDRSKR